MNFKLPKASEAIAAIQKLIDAHGDIPIALDDPDTGWIMPIGVEYQNNDGEEIIAVVSDYHGKPDNCIGECVEID